MRHYLWINEKMKFCYDILQGLAYMHAQKRYHSNLLPKFIRFDRNRNPMIGGLVNTRWIEEGQTFMPDIASLGQMMLILLQLEDMNKKPEKDRVPQHSYY